MAVEVEAKATSTLSGFEPDTEQLPAMPESCTECVPVATFVKVTESPVATFWLECSVQGDRVAVGIGIRPRWSGP